MTTISNETWPEALAAARCGADVSVETLEAVAEAMPHNQLVPQVLALALARTGDPAALRRADAVWRKRGLPHDTDLLARTALMFEEQARVWDASCEEAVERLPWPEGLARPEPLPPADEDAECDTTSPPPAPKRPERPGRRERRELARAANTMERWILDHRPAEVLERTAQLTARGLEDAKCHMMAGMAAEETGDAARARAHLARALTLDEHQLLARTWLGRVYWHLGRFEGAVALWRSLPVEGPNDYGRHYHLALGYAALGREEWATVAMRHALEHFHYDTRHFFVQRAWDAWRRRVSRP